MAVKVPEPDRKMKKKDINMIGKVSDKANVPKVTQLHKDLVHKSHQVANEEAGLTKDKRIKGYGSSDEGFSK